MKNNEENRSCGYDAGMVCFYNRECRFTSLVDCLRQNLFLAQKELELLRKKRNERHTKTSIKWRDTSFYYKKRAKALETWIVKNGLVVPHSTILFLNEEKKDESILNSSQERIQPARDNS